MKKLYLLSGLVSIISLAHADSGFYVGIGTGYANLTSSTTNGFSYMDGATSKSGSNMLGSVYAGYDFNRYVGMQFDYDYLADVQYTTGTTVNPGVQGSFSANQQILSLGITGHLPFELFANSLAGLSVFGKLAVGVSILNFSGGVVGAGNGLQYTQDLPANAQSMVPVVGFGAEYGMKSVGVRLEYDYIGNTSVSSDNQNLLNVNNSLGLVSVFYHF